MADDLKLYRVLYDGQPYYVEAPSFALAIEAWKRYVKAEWKEEYDGTEEPESVECLDSDHPVIRKVVMRRLVRVLSNCSAFAVWRDKDGQQGGTHGPFKTAEEALAYNETDEDVEEGDFVVDIHPNDAPPTRLYVRRRGEWSTLLPTSELPSDHVDTHDVSELQG